MKAISDTLDSDGHSIGVAARLLSLQGDPVRGAHSPYGGRLPLQLLHLLHEAGLAEMCLALSAHPAARAADFICIRTACASCRITILLSGPTKYAGFQAMMGWTGQTV